MRSENIKLPQDEICPVGVLVCAMGGGVHIFLDDKHMLHTKPEWE